MANLVWITPQKTIANMETGVPVSIQIEALDTRNVGNSISYHLISGSLPAGLTLSPSGVISGTPSYLNNATNYFNNNTFNFVIRARTLDLSIVDGAFSIIVTNAFNKGFAWVTASGSLGTLPNSEYYDLPLLAEDASGSMIQYEFISGTLPPGMQVVTYTQTVSVAKNQLVANVLQMASVEALAVSYYVFGTGVPAQTTIAAIDSVALTVTLSNNVTTLISAGTEINFVSQGYLQGTPTLLTAETFDQSTEYQFTVRAFNAKGEVRDQGFSLTITNVSAPIILPSTQFLGDVFDGAYFNEQLVVSELNPNAKIQWSLVNGSLPTGVSLNTSTGVLSGYITPLPLTGQFGPPGFDGDSATQGVITQQQDFDSSPYDFNNITQSLSYSFTVQAYDGANYAQQQYTISVISRTGFTADTANLVNDTYITIDSDIVYTPLVVNPSRTMPIARANSYYAFQVVGYDYQGDAITYSISQQNGTFDASTATDIGFDVVAFDSSNLSGGASSLPGIGLDSNTGWISGFVLTGSTAPVQQYQIGVTLSKTHNTSTGAVVVSSVPVYFNLTVLSNINNILKWSSPANLGTINNGAISELYISAVSTLGYGLKYSLVNAPGVSCALPQGLTLLPNGEISGRVSFEIFTVDRGDCTFDNKTNTYDHTYSFVAQAATPDGVSVIAQEFTITVAQSNKYPYVDLYLHALISNSERQLFNSIINNTEIFNTAYLYRPYDPWFGVQTRLSTLFLPGLNAKTLDQFESAIAENHYIKNYNFGDVKTASVLDANYNVKYEVVYVEIIDPEETASNKGPALEIDLQGAITNPYIDSSGNQIEVLYPNTSTNMIDRLVSAINYQNQNSLPDWMTSNQPGQSGGNTFSPPLGFVKAVVLAYALPGKGSLLAYRIKNSNFNFNQIQFTTDRYEIDNYYASNFDFASNTFAISTETTFDTTPTQIGVLSNIVNYGVSIPFDQINGRSVDYINSNFNGLDGVQDFATGDTLIFVKQENFTPIEPYDGWLQYTDGFIGTSLTGGTGGYDSGAFDGYSIVPGYLNNISSTNNFTGDGVTTLYTITQYITDPTQVKVYINSVLQPSTSYTISGTKLTLVSAPAFTTPPPLPAQITVYNGSYYQELSGDGVIRSFALSAYAGVPSLVTVNGTSVSPSSYSVSQTTVNAGSFVIGQTYVVSSVGTLTDWTAVGFNGLNSSVVVGSIFTATAAGSGDGVATCPTITFNTAPPLRQLSPTAPTITVTVGNNKNERAGIWQININNGIVNLVFLSTVPLNNRVQIIHGGTYSGAILFYNPIYSSPQTVPGFTTFVIDPTTQLRKTTFNNNTTKFFSYRDQYYTPGSEAKYIKFPQYGVFN